MHKFDIIKERNKQLSDQRPLPYAIKLHLTLGDEEASLLDNEASILRKYGKMTEAIARDIIVPGDITLGALHYAINKAFGWQNSHLHSFHAYEDEFDKMVKKRNLSEWAKLAGMYFRFPCDDYRDLYWNDDYDGHMNIKIWFRKKYTGPYFYGGTREFFYRMQEEVETLYKHFPILEVHKSFSEWYEETKDLVDKTGDEDAKADKIKRIAPIEEVTIDELMNSICFEGGFDELIERIPLYDILLMPDAKQDFDAWNFINRRVLKDAEKEYRCLAPATTPILSAIRYWYDYGDNWNVRITATDCYETKQEYELDGFPVEALNEHRPVCVFADALPVLDDVGGISGYCNMLEVLRGRELEDQEEKESLKEWAKTMGWTGRIAKPENIL